MMTYLDCVNCQLEIDFDSIWLLAVHFYDHDRLAVKMTDLLLK